MPSTPARQLLTPFVLILFLFGLPASAQETATPPDTDDGTFNEAEILDAAGNFFGEVSEGLAQVIEKGRDLTRDIGGTAGTKEMGEAVVAAIATL